MVRELFIGTRWFYSSRYTAPHRLELVVPADAAPTLGSMWETPQTLWRRLRLGREEYLQRLMTTLIVGGDPPPWNTRRSPSEHGQRTRG